MTGIDMIAAGGIGTEAPLTDRLGGAGHCPHAPSPDPADQAALHRTDADFLSAHATWPLPPITVAQGAGPIIPIPAMAHAGRLRFIDTPPAERGFCSGIPPGHEGRAEDMAGTAAFPASADPDDNARRSLRADGGITRRP